MSGFFGVFSPGGNIDIDAFNKMQKAIHREVYDELETKIDDCIAMGHLMLRVTTESVYDQQPLKSSCGRYMLTGHFRLDYRDDLGDKLGLNHKELEVTPDSTLAMLAYQKWGDKCVSHLEGDWAFVLYDYQNKSLFAARDKFGYSSLFYYKSNNKVYFSSDLDVLFSALKNLQVDNVQLYLMGFGRNYITHGRTIYKNVYFLIPSTSIKVNSDFKYFKQNIILFETNQRRVYKSEFDYILEFRSSFQFALKNKISHLKCLGMYLSGGFDSVLIAKSTDFQYRISKQKLNTFTRTPIEVDKVINVVKKDLSEFEVVQKLFNEFKQTQFHSSAFEHVFTSDFLNQNAPLNSFNPILTANTYWLEGIMLEAQSKGLKGLLVGQFGNYSLSWDAPKIDLFDSFLSLIKNYIKILLNRYMIHNNIFNKKNLLSLKQRLYVTMVLLKRQKFFLTSRGLRIYLLQQNTFDLGARHYQRGFKYNVIVVDPTADERFLKTSLCFPEKLFNKNQMPKYIYKESFKSLLSYDFFSHSTTNINQSLNFKYKLDRDFKFISQLFELSRIYQNDKNINVKFLHTVFLSNAAEKDLQKISDVNMVHLLRHVSLLHFYQKKVNFDL